MFLRDLVDRFHPANRLQANFGLEVRRMCPAFFTFTHSLSSFRGRQLKPLSQIWGPLYKVEREDYANLVVDRLLACLLAQEMQAPVRKELLKLIAPHPYSLGRALGVPLRKSTKDRIPAGSPTDTTNVVEQPDEPFTVNETGTGGTSTSCLCYELTQQQQQQQQRPTTSARLSDAVQQSCASASPTTAHRSMLAVPTAMSLPILATSSTSDS